MSKDREGDLIQRLKALGRTESGTVLREILALRRERYRDRLESEESAEVRGKSKECRDLLQLFD